jgi:hypothetical protein
MYTFGSPVLPTDLDPDTESTTSHMMINTSRIDVTLSPSSAGLARYPEFVDKVVPVAQQAVLEEGDLLFMPPG